jgi:hypothetical protein
VGARGAARHQGQAACAVAARALTPSRTPGGRLSREDAGIPASGHRLAPAAPCRSGFTAGAACSSPAVPAAERSQDPDSQPGPIFASRPRVYFAERRTTARRRRCSSANRRRLVPSCSRCTRFSFMYSMTFCCSRFSQPASATRTTCQGDMAPASRLWSQRGQSAAPEIARVSSPNSHIRWHYKIPECPA